MPIRWKVVRDDRQSFVVSPNSEYSLLYIKGTIVKEKRKGLGVMCFETEELAKKFAVNALAVGIAKVIKVNGIGRGKKVKLVAYISKGTMLENYIQNFFNNQARVREAPKGTICYKSVEVLT